MDQEAIYAGAGFGGSATRGRKPAILVVDFSYGFTDTRYPTAADMSSEIAATRRITDRARDAGMPVIYTTIAFGPLERDSSAWLKKARGMADLMVGSRLVEIDERCGMAPGDAVIVKHGASAFFGTALAALLTGAGVDTVVITGATTSGCVRASVVDAVQSGFHVLVPRDCCADRARDPHEANLYDISQKYADVIDADEVLTWIEQLSSARRE